MGLWLLLLNLAILVVLFALVTRLRPPHQPSLWRFGLLATLFGADALVILWLNFQLSTLAALGLSLAVSSSVIPAAQTRVLTHRLAPVRLALFLLSVLTVASLAFVHLPIGTFLTSPGELELHQEYLLKHNTTEMMVLVYLSALLYAVALSPRMRSTFTLSAFVTAVLVVIYSYLLPFGYPAMSGLTFEQIPIPPATILLRIAFDAILVFGVTALCIFLVLRVRPQRLIVGLLLLNLSLISTSTLQVLRDSSPTAVTGTGTHGPQNVLSLSKSNPNVLVILLDRFMGSYIEDAIKDAPELEQKFKGFVWFPRTVAAGENSIAGVHPIFGGYDYTPIEMNARKKALRDVSVEAYRILPWNFSKADYQVHLANPRGLGFTMTGDCEHVQDIAGVTCSHVPAAVSNSMAKDFGFPITSLSQASYAHLLVLLGAMRGGPYSIKEMLTKKGSWTPFMDHTAGTTFRQWAELKALPQLTQVHAGPSRLNMFWNILPHEPYFIGHDCKPRQTMLDPTREEALAAGHESPFAMMHAITAHCTLSLVADYLDWMKSQGVYDNTKIVLVSDHGIVGPVTDHSTRAVAGRTEGKEYVRSRSLLMVKDREAHGDLRTSEEFLPNAEVPRIVCEEIGGCVNPYLNNRSIDAHGRDDPFFVDLVPWQFSQQRPDAFIIRERWRLRGKDPFNKAGWERLAQPDGN